MPYGWFAEGWKVDDGKAKSKATKDSGNNGMPGMGGGGGMPNMNENPGTPGSGGMPGMGGMFGSDRLRTYMLTPPVSVKSGEKLVFSARKPKPDDSSGMGFSFDPVGTWHGTFQTINNEEATAMAAYANFGGGHIKIICGDSEYERTVYIPTFRAFYEPKNHQSIGAKDCVIKFIQTLQGDIDEFEFVDFPADVFGTDMPTGINSPVFHVIEADGSHRYFDLQGRQLDKKPRTGIYIMNGKKYSEK